MQSSHVFTNRTGDIPGAEMFEAQLKRLKSLSVEHTYTLQSGDNFLSVCLRGHILAFI